MIFGGMKKYVPNITEPFPIPVIWLLIHITPLIVLANSISCEFSVYEQQIIYRIQDRRLWWIKKMCGIVIQVTLYYIIIYLMLFLYSIFFHISIDLNYSNGIFSAVDFGENANNSYGENLELECMLLPYMFTLTLAIIQCVLSLWVKPTIAIVFSIFILFTSAYYASPLLPGSYSMAMRSDKFLGDGVNIYIGICYYCFEIVLSFLVGMKRFSNIDIITKELENGNNF